jgi:DNA-binding MarR family transcriptional regulator
MVKQLDDMPELIDHVGWDLWRASAAWKARFVAGMVVQGHAWFSEARANLLGCLDRGGTRQADLVARLGTTKQAVQQLVDELVAGGILMRVADPADGRGRIVRFTATGLAALADANKVKRRIEAEYRALLGARRFAELSAALRRLAEAG